MTLNTCLRGMTKSSSFLHFRAVFMSYCPLIWDSVEIYKEYVWRRNDSSCPRLWPTWSPSQMQAQRRDDQGPEAQSTGVAQEPKLGVHCKDSKEEWYVANVSINFDAPCLFYTNCYMFCLHFVALLWFIWTNLLIVAKVHNVFVLHFDV
jgi:hypothetical protein